MDVIGLLAISAGGARGPFQWFPSQYFGGFFGLWAELLEPRIPCASPKGAGEPKDLGSGGPLGAEKARGTLPMENVPAERVGQG